MNPLKKASSYRPFRWGAAIAGITATMLLFLPGLHIGGYSANQFLPHATCYLRVDSGPESGCTVTIECPIDGW